MLPRFLCSVIKSSGLPLAPEYWPQDLSCSGSPSRVGNSRDAFWEQAPNHSSSVLWRQPAGVQVCVSSWASYLFDLQFLHLSIRPNYSMYLTGVLWGFYGIMNGKPSTVSVWPLGSVQDPVAVISTVVSPTSLLRSVLLLAPGSFMSSQLKLHLSNFVIVRTKWDVLNVKVF